MDLHEGRGFLERQIGTLVDRMTSVEHALRRGGEVLREEQGGEASVYVERLADQCDSLGRYLKSASVDDLVQDGSDFARRHPEVFVGACFIAGLGVARFLRASSKPHAHAGARDDALRRDATSFDEPPDRFAAHGRTAVERSPERRGMDVRPGSEFRPGPMQDHSDLPPM